MMEPDVDNNYESNFQGQRLVPEHRSSIMTTSFSTNERQRSATLPISPAPDELTTASYCGDSAAEPAMDHMNRRSSTLAASLRSRNDLQSRSFNGDYVSQKSQIELAENSIEANRISNNYTVSRNVRLR